MAVSWPSPSLECILANHQGGNTGRHPCLPHVTTGTALRQFWVNGERAQRTRVYGHGRQTGDNRKGYCHNLTNTTPTPLYPAGSAYDFAGEYFDLSRASYVSYGLNVWT